MPLNLQFDGLAVQVERQRRAHGEFLGALQCALGKGLHEAAVVEEFVRTVPRSRISSVRRRNRCGSDPLESRARTACGHL